MAHPRAFIPSANKSKTNYLSRISQNVIEQKISLNTTYQKDDLETTIMWQEHEAQKHVVKWMLTLILIITVIIVM